MKFICFLSYFLFKDILGVSSRNNHFDRLIKYLKEESKLYQVVFIRVDESDIKDPVMDSLEKEVNTNFPSLSISGIQENIMRMQHAMLLKRSRRTTLYVFHCTNSNSFSHQKDFTFMVTQIRWLSGGKPLPRCLIINCYSNDILNTFWQKKFLDITLMSYNNEHQVMLKTISHKLPLLTMSEYNPFTNKTNMEIVSADSKWFPNKLHDLNGYKLNFSCPSLNSFTCKEKASIRLAELMAQTLNLTFEIQKTNADFYLDLKRNYNDEIIVNTDLRFLKLSSSKFVIPKNLKHSKKIIVSPEFWYMLLLTFCTVALIRFTAFCMRFKRSTWQMLNISKIIMGMSTDEEPNNFRGRLIFGSLLITCLVYSGYFHSVIVDISWHSEPEISNLEELADSSLIPMMRFSTKSMLQRCSIPYFRKLAERAIEMEGEGMESDCWRHLIDSRNVSCLFHNAEYIVNGYAASQKLSVTLLSEPVEYYFSNWRSRINSPYIDRFNEVILRASEFGLLKDFYADPDVEHHNPSLPENIDKKTLLLVLFCISVIGYSLSIIVFLFEIFIVNCERRINGFYTSFRFAN